MGCQLRLPFWGRCMQVAGWGRCTMKYKLHAWLGLCCFWCRVVANDAASYQYLVESIRMFPDQEAWAGVRALCAGGSLGQGLRCGLV